jgi:hypothetical protein
MRTLTFDELGYVSGGEAPCVTLKTPCVGPPPTAEEVSNALYGLAAASQLFAEKTKIRHASFVAALAAAAAWTIEQFATDGENHTPPGGQTANTPPPGPTGR